VEVPSLEKRIDPAMLSQEGVYPALSDRAAGKVGDVSLVRLVKLGTPRQVDVLELLGQHRPAVRVVPSGLLAIPGEPAIPEASKSGGLLRSEVLQSST
jgi:hypothetical protein